MKTYTLKEAIGNDLISPGDTFKTEDDAYCDFTMYQDGTVKNSNGHPLGISKENLGIVGQIIPAKKESVKFGEWWYIYPDCHCNRCKRAAKDSWQASAENQDILYADLMDIIDSTEVGYQNVADKIRELKKEAGKIYSIIDPL